MIPLIVSEGRAHDAVSLEPARRLRARVRHRTARRTTYRTPFVLARVAARVRRSRLVIGVGVPARVARAGQGARRRAAPAHTSPRPPWAPPFIVAFALHDHAPGLMGLADVARPALVQHDLRGLRLRGHFAAGPGRHHPPTVLLMRRHRFAPWWAKAASRPGQDPLRLLHLLGLHLALPVPAHLVRQPARGDDHYLTRTSPAWFRCSSRTFWSNWVVPFLGLLPRATKRGSAAPGGVACCPARPLARPVSLIMPASFAHTAFGVAEPLIAAATARSSCCCSAGPGPAPLVPPGDPSAAEETAGHHA